MLFKTLSPSGTALQLPGLAVGKISTDYIDIINEFYEVDLDPADYKVTQVYLNSANKPTLELIPLQLNASNDILKFESRKAVTVTNTTVVNPLSNMMGEFLRANPIWVLGAQECDFLATLPIGTPRNIFALGDVIPASLALMLNSVDGQPKWEVSPNATYSTAGFSVDYYGDVSTAPDKYLYPDEATTVCIISILQGGYTGKLLVCTK